MGLIQRVSPRLKGFYRIAFFLVVLGLFLEVGAVLLVPNETMYMFEAKPAALFAFGLLFVAVATLVCANFSLWVGMLYFLVRHDSSPGAERVVWFVVVFFGLSFGAAVYYWFVYRKVPETIEGIQ